MLIVGDEPITSGCTIRDAINDLIAAGRDEMVKSSLQDGIDAALELCEQAGGILIEQ